jgi:hypothetical protein
VMELSARGVPEPLSDPRLAWSAALLHALSPRYPLHGEEPPGPRAKLSPPSPIACGGSKETLLCHSDPARCPPIQRRRCEPPNIRGFRNRYGAPLDNPSPANTNRVVRPTALKRLAPLQAAGLRDPKRIPVWPSRMRGRATTTTKTAVLDGLLPIWLRSSTSSIRSSSCDFFLALIWRSFSFPQHHPPSARWAYSPDPTHHHNDSEPNTEFSTPLRTYGAHPHLRQLCAELEPRAFLPLCGRSISSHCDSRTTTAVPNGHADSPVVGRSI